jgi:hypothetical protein
MKADDRLSEDTGAENAPKWNPTPEAIRAMDLSVFVYALRNITGKTTDIITNCTVMGGLAFGAHEFRDELIAWAEGELAKVKEVR